MKNSPNKRTALLPRVAVLLSLTVCGLLTLPLAAYGDAPEYGDTSELVQLMCPVMPEQQVDPDIFVEYEGRTVYLCCQKCKRLFETTPEKYVDAIVLTTAPPEFLGEDDDGGHHDHAEGLLHKVGRMHPIAVHFPVALLVTAALARCLVLLGALPWAGSAVRFCVWVGGAGAVVAATLGWFDAGAPGEAEALGDLVFNHRWLGVATVLLGVVLIVLIEKEARKAEARPTGLTTAALILVACLVGVTGHYGGMLTHGVDYLPW